MHRPQMLNAHLLGPKANPSWSREPRVSLLFCDSSAVIYEDILQPLLCPVLPPTLEISKVGSFEGSGRPQTDEVKALIVSSNLQWILPA